MRTRVGDDVSFRDHQGFVHSGTVINSRFSAWTGVQTWSVLTPDGESDVTADRFLRGAHHACCHIDESAGLAADHDRDNI